MSGLPPKHGLHVNVASGLPPKHGNPGHSMAARQNPASAVRDGEADFQPFTRSEIASVRLGNAHLHPFSVLVSLQTPDAVRIESVEISICEEDEGGDESVCSVPISSSSVVLRGRGDNQVFSPTDRQFAAISEALEHGNSVKFAVRYLAPEQSELMMSIIRKDSHHKLGYFVAIVGLGLAVQALTKHRSRSA